jgi:putative DNA primase/helicase
MKGEDIARVKDAARGRWPELLMEMAPALSGAISRFPRHVACPVHGGRDGFRLFADWQETGGGLCNTCGAFPNGFALLRWVTGMSFPDVVEGIADRLRINIQEEHNYGWVNDTAARLRLQAIWRDSGPDDGRISAYLSSRGLSGVVPPSLRLHPSLPYRDATRNQVAAYPALIAPVQSPSGEVVALHRIYLRQDGSGKADVADPKKMLPAVWPGATRGAAVRLGRIAPTINLAEGIETAIAVQEYTQTTTLSGVNAGGVERFIAPSGIRRVTIWGDNDASGTGMRVAERARRNLSDHGLLVDVKIPDMTNTDWLDVLTG